VDVTTFFDFGLRCYCAIIELEVFLCCCSAGVDQTRKPHVNKDLCTTLECGHIDWLFVLVTILWTLLCPLDRWHDKPQCFRILPRLVQFRN